MSISRVLCWLLPQLWLAGWAAAAPAPPDAKGPTDAGKPTTPQSAPTAAAPTAPSADAPPPSAEPPPAPATAAPVVELSNQTETPATATEPAAESPPPTRASPPAAPPPTQTSEPSRELPVRSDDTRVSRAERPFAIGGEIGWNSLAGLGVQATYHPIPYLAFDGGAGLSQVGLKGGLRVRANLLTSEWTPVLGVGFIYGLGTMGEKTEAQVEDESVTFQIWRSKYLQAVVGVNYTSVNGFVFMATGGYAFLLHENVHYLSGSEDALDTIKPILHGGVSIAFTFGYAFHTGGQPQP